MKRSTTHTGKFSIMAAALAIAGFSGQAFAAPITWSSNGHTYSVVYSNSISWDDSRAAAQALGAGWDLASITSMDEQNFIVSQIGPGNGELYEFYIGGTYVNGAWTWSNGDAFSFSYFGAGEPNYMDTEHYIALDARYNVPNWGWNNYTGAGSYFVSGYVAEHSGSTEAVPEPSTLGLLALGLVGLGYRFRKRNA